MLYSKDRLFKLLLTNFLILTVCATCNAQYHPLYSQYMFNGQAINPAYAGSHEALNIAVLYRSSQFGKSVEGAPVTKTLAGDFQLRNPVLALGLTVFDDNISILRQSGAYFTYTYRIQAGTGKLSFGLQAGFDLLREDQRNLRIIDESDKMFDLEPHNTFMPNVGVGTYYYMSNFFAGLSIPQILSYSLKTASSYSSKPALTNTMLNCGLTVATEKGFNMRPSTMIQFTGRKIIFDINTNFIMLKERLELGISWRSINTLIMLAQIKISQLSIGYAYDYAINRPGLINSHEIMLRYNLRIKVKAASPLSY